MGKIFSFIFLLFFTFSLQAQNLVCFTKNGKVSNLHCKQTATYEHINGKINLSITTNDNQLIELNNIDEKLFTCGKKLKSEAFNIIVIDNNKNITYTSKSTVQVLIKCYKNSKFVKVTFSGNVYDQANKMNVYGILFVKQSPSQNLKTN